VIKKMRNDFGWGGFVGLEILSNYVLLPTLFHMKSMWGFVTTPSAGSALISAVTIF